MAAMKPYKILAFDTSTDACSVAILIDGRVSELFELVPQQHTQVILPMIKNLLCRENISLDEIDALGFGNGPGSFTGVRLATSIAQGLGYGSNLPLVPVSTLAVLAERIFNECCPAAISVRAYVGMDARMQEVYWGVYEKCLDSFSGARIIQCLVADSLAKAEEVLLPNNTLDLSKKLCSIGVGSAWLQYGDLLLARCTVLGEVDKVCADYYPRAREVAVIAHREFSKGNFVEPQMALPQYLRDRVTS